MTARTGELSVLVVHESMFGNTARVAEAVAAGLVLEGLVVTLRSVAEAPAGSALAHDLLVVGAPTHGSSLSRPGTRSEAVLQGASPEHRAIGLREWLGAVKHDEHGPSLVAVFDTRVNRTPHLPRSASTRAVQICDRRGLPLLAKPVSFLVAGIHGPVLEHELDRATAWGRWLAVGCRQHLVGGPARSPGPYETPRGA